MAQIHSNFSAGVLITGGLGADGLSGALITAAKWHLFGCEATITLPPIVGTSSGGGSRPYAPGEIQNFYKPVNIADSDSHDYIPVSLETRSKNTIIVKFKINDITNEKEFVLREKPYKYVIKLINIINITDNVIKITLKNIKHNLNNIKIKLKKIRLRRD